MFKSHYWTGFNSFSRAVFEPLCGGEKSPTSSFRMRLRTSLSSPSTVPDMRHPSCVTRGCRPALGLIPPSHHVPPPMVLCRSSSPELSHCCALAKAFLLPGVSFLYCSLWKFLFFHQDFTVTFSVNVLHDLFPLQTPELRSLPGLRSLLSLLLIPVIQTITLCYNFIFAYISLMRQYYEQLENKYLVLKFMHVT